MEDLVGDVEFGGHIDERRVSGPVFYDVNPFLVREILDCVVNLVLYRFDERLAFFVEFALLTEILAFEFEHLLLFLHNFLLALAPHSLGEEDLLCLVVGCHDPRLLRRCVNLFLPAFG